MAPAHSHVRDVPHGSMSEEDEDERPIPQDADNEDDCKDDGDNVRFQPLMVGDVGLHVGMDEEWGLGRVEGLHPILTLAQQVKGFRIRQDLVKE